MSRARFSGCIEWLFAEESEDLVGRVKAAANEGLDAVEFWMWRGRDLEAINAAATEAGITVAGICVEPWGQLTDPATHDEFVSGVADSIEAPKKLGCTTLVSQVGQERIGVSREEQHASIVDALGKVAPMLEDNGIFIVIEPLNTCTDHPGYFLSDTAEGIEIIKEVDSPVVRLLYDRYHAAMMGEEIGYGVDGNFEYIRHIHLADVPGRHQQGAGSLNWGEEMAYFRSQNYEGFFGLEYMPTVSTKESLKYIRSYSI